MRQQEKAKVTEAPRPARILVVEDDGDVRLGYQVLLKANYYDTFFAADAATSSTLPHFDHQHDPAHRRRPGRLSDRSLIT